MDIQTGEQKTAAGICEKIVSFYVVDSFSSLVVHLGYIQAVNFVYLTVCMHMAWFLCMCLLFSSSLLAQNTALTNVNMTTQYFCKSETHKMNSI